jgi:hypothetical protein
MEFSKKKLLSIINEVNDMDIDEGMPHKNPISRPLKNDNGELIGHDMRVNPHDEDSPRINVIFTCDINEFVQSHSELVQKLKEQYGNIKWTDDYCPKHRPHLKGKETRKFYPLPGEEEGPDIERKSISIQDSKTDRTNILLKLNPLLKSKLENDEITRHLEVCSVPPIKPTEKTHIDKHSEISNNSILYRTHNLCFYDTPQDFLKSVINRVKGKPAVNVNCVYMPRQYNKVYRNWDPTKKTENEWLGLTDVYKLKKLGFEENNLDVMVSMSFEIRGVKRGTNGYTWTIIFKTEYGKKLKDDPRVKNLTQDKDFVVTKEVPEDPEDERQFTNRHTVLDNPSIYFGLEEALGEMTQKLMSIDKKEALSIANIKSYEMNEGIEKIVRDTIKNMLR